jgi:hypothetical protein
MLRISAAKIAEFAKELDGIEIQGIHFHQAEAVKGIQVLFSVDTPDEELAKNAVKSYLKANHPAHRVYVEII